MDDSRREALEKEVTRLTKINRALMARVERSTDLTGGAFSLFQAATVLEEKIQERTEALQAVLRKLEASNADLKRAKEAADLANAAKSEFLANMSHELRTPLHGILSFASFGVDKHGSATREKLHRYFKHIRQSGDVLLALLNDLLDLAKLESGKMSFELAPADFGLIVGTVVDEFSSRFSEKGLVVRSKGPQRGVLALADSHRIKQVIRNLLSNAVRFSPRCGSVECALEHDSEVVRVIVRDMGPGIKEEELETVFNKFVQSSTTKTGAGGTGLGLAICREIIDAHGGRIWADNNRDGGAAFFFEIPSFAETDAPIPCGLKSGPETLPL